MSEEKRWYVIHTYSGYENKVKANLERKIQSLGLENEIFNILVPMEEEVDYKDGAKKVVLRKVFPGYVLVEMIVNDHSWYVVRNTPGVTGFVGSGTKPTTPASGMKGSTSATIATPTEVASSSGEGRVR